MTPSANLTNKNNKPVPKDANVIEAMLRDVGIEDYDPSLVNLLVEMSHRMSVELLELCRDFGSYSNRLKIELEEAQMAVEFYNKKNPFRSAIPPDVMRDIAKVKNAIPIQPIKAQNGPRLPPDRFCLTQPNYQLKRDKEKEAPVENATTVSTTTTPNKTITVTTID